MILVTFRDAAELLQFSVTYNSNYLKIFVTEFICWNMATFLESRLLDNLDSQLLNDLTKSYRNLVKKMIDLIIIDAESQSDDFIFLFSSTA